MNTRCAHCGKTLSVTRQKQKGKYCDRACSSAARRAQRWDVDDIPSPAPGLLDRVRSFFYPQQVPADIPFLIVCMRITFDAVASARRAELRAAQEANARVEKEISQLRQEVAQLRREVGHFQNIKLNFIHPHWLVQYGLPVRQIEAVSQMARKMFDPNEYSA